MNTPANLTANWLPPEVQKLHSIGTELKETVLGHDQAIDTVLSAVHAAIGRRGGGKGPAGAFTFVGPVGVGKRFLATELAERLGRQCFVVDMSSLTDDNGFTLNGVELGYAGCRPADLSMHVYNHPDSVVVFDEFHLAHPAQQAIAATLFSGAIIDRCGVCVLPNNRATQPAKLNNGKDVYDYNNLPPTCKLVSRIDYSRTVVIFVTSAGQSVYENQQILHLLREDPDQASDILSEALARPGSDINPGLLAELRRGSFVLFDRLRFEPMAGIARKLLDQVASQFASTNGLPKPVKLDEQVAQAIILAIGPEPKPAKLNPARLYEMLFSPLMQHLQTLPALQGEVEVGLSPAAAAQFEAFLADLGGEGDVLHELFRRSARLRYRQAQVPLKGGKASSRIKWHLDGLELVRVKSAADYAEGGIRIERPTQTFDDIAGHHDVKRRLRQVLGWLKNPREAKEALGSIPRGIFLYGPPGTGKTLIAKALAAEAGSLPFISTTGAELLDARRTIDIFERARRYAPAIIFIDEIDALGSRTTDPGHAVAINSLLTQIDGFDSSDDKPVFVVAATNFAERVDSAIIRPGRIDIHTLVPHLDRDARKFFIDKFVRIPGIGKLDEAKLLRMTAGMSGSAMEQIVRETRAELTGKSGGGALTPQQVLLAKIHQSKYGHPSTVDRSEHETWRTAIHEAAHAVMTRILNPGDLIEIITIVPSSKFGGLVATNPEESAPRLMTQEEYRDDICIGLAGTVAEHLIAKVPRNPGAASDLAQATLLALQGITQHGMDPEIGLINMRALYGQANTPQEHAAIDAALANLPEVRAAVKRWLTEEEKRASELVTRHQDIIRRVAEALVERETLSQAELDALMS